MTSPDEPDQLKTQTSAQPVLSPQPSALSPESRPQTPLGEIALLFLKLGTIAFGGPAAHVAMMRDEVVRRRKWLTDQEFLDLLGAANLIPGPTSTEMTIHIGRRQAGWRGLIVAGTCFIVPAMLIVLALGWAYVQLGSAPEAAWVLYGVKPVIIAVVLQALWALGRAAVKNVPLGLVGAAVLGLYFLGVNVLLLLFAGGLLVMFWENGWRAWKARSEKLSAFLVPLPLILGQMAPGVAGFSLGTLFLTFLKIGAVLYGGGYVLLAFVRADFVGNLHWLTDHQLLDAVAIGQVTPGPLFTTATFIGYILGGLPGGLIATLGIFLPGFFFVAISSPFIPRLRRSPWTAALLDGVNVAALGLMAAVTVQLGQAAIVDWFTVVVMLSAAALLLRFRINSAWLVLGGSVVGLVYKQFLG